MKRFFTQFRLPLFALSMFLVLSNIGCKDDEEPTPNNGTAPIASFQYAVDADNFATVTFTNFSQNATIYDWDFGDGTTSAEESPVHIYATTGTFDVVLTSSNADGESAQRTETLTITDPNEALTVLAGTASKTWYIQRQGIGLGVGPVVNDNQYFALGSEANPLGDRPCVLDDSYTFHRDGTFEFNSNGTLYIDETAFGGWLEGNDGGCYEETTANLTASTGEDLSSFASGGDYTYAYDQTASTLTLDGLGAYIGLAAKTAQGDNYIPLPSKEFTIFNLAEGPIADTLQVALVGEISWNFYLVSYENEADLPAIPTAVATSVFSFEKDGLTVTFNNFSTNADTFAWDFGDGNTSNEESPVHIYAGEGEYNVTLTVTDSDGVTATSSQVVILSSATFSASALSSAAGKVWKLPSDAAYYVGPTAGSSEWYSVDAGTLDNRPCQTNDEFIFFDNGDFEYDTKGDVFADEFMCTSPAACINETDLATPYDVYSSAMHGFEVNEDVSPIQLKVIGQGAFLGFNKGFNNGEGICDGAFSAPSEITYDVLEYTNVGGKETIVVSVFLNNENGEGWWTMVLESE